jgi:flagellar protein FlaG
MDSKVVSIAPALEPSLAPTRPVAADAGTKVHVANGQDQADLRLIIEEDNGSGSYVYKTVDRRTGEVVQQFPREQILKMQGENEYAAGAVINAKA